MAHEQNSFGVAILAAGKSSRMGRPKMLLSWGGTTVLGHQVAAWKQAGVAQVAVVIAVGDTLIGRELDTIGIAAEDRIVNPDVDRGMFSSIQCAAAWAGWEAGLSHVVIALGDQPQLRLQTLRLLIEAAQKEPDNIWQPAFEGAAKHPVVLPKELFLQLGRCNHQNLREALDSMKDRIRLVELADPGLNLDIDSPADYEKAVRLASAESGRE